MTVKAALYIRVSTEEQAREGFSIPEQTERLQAFCLAHGWTDYALYIDDGYSAKDTHRPAFQRMLADIRSHEVQVVITTKIDRLTRRLIDLLSFVNELDLCQCTYKSASETFDTSTAVGRMVLQLLGVFAEFERERIAERVHENMYHLAKQGKVVTAPCFGYDVVNGLYVLNAEEAKWTRKMTAMLLDGHGTWTVAKMLNDHQVRTKRGREWTLKAVRTYLWNNEMLRGNTVWNRQFRKNGKLIERPASEWLLVENTHEPILDPDTYDQLQLVLRQNRRIAPRSKNSEFLLSGLVYCGHCGSKMYGLNASFAGSGKAYRPPAKYLCSGYSKKGHCFHHYIHTIDLDKHVMNEVFRLAEAALAQELDGVSLQATTLQEGLAHTKRQLSAMDERFARQLRAFELGIIDEGELAEARMRLTAEKNEAAAKREALECALQSAHSPERIQEQMRSKLAQLHSGVHGQEEQASLQAIIRECIHHVTIYNGSQIEIHFCL